MSTGKNNPKFATNNQPKGNGGRGNNNKQIGADWWPKARTSNLKPGEEGTLPGYTAYISQFILEFLGCMMFAVIALLPIALTEPYGWQALAAGIGLYASLICFGQWDNTLNLHLNPTVTFGACFIGHMRWGIGLLYICIVQPAGYAAGVGLIVAMLRDSNYGTPVINFGVSPAIAFVIELIGSTFLHIAFLYTYSVVSLREEFLEKYNAPGFVDTYIRKPIKNPEFMIAAVYTALEIAFIPLTGGVFNFYKYLWSAVMSNTITGIGVGIYLGGSAGGMIIAVLWCLGFNFWKRSDMEYLQKWELEPK